MVLQYSRDHMSKNMCIVAVFMSNDFHSYHLPVMQ